MSFFEPVDVRIWGDFNFRNLCKAQPNGQTLWLHLLTGPHNRGLPGLFNVGAGEIGEILGWQPGDVVTIFQQLSKRERPMAMADWPARVVFLPNVFSHKAPQSANNIIGWQKPFDMVPESKLRDLWVAALCEHCKGREKALMAALESHYPVLDQKDMGQEPPIAPPIAPPPRRSRSKSTSTTTPKPQEKEDSEASKQAVEMLIQLMKENDDEAKFPVDPSKAMVVWKRDFRLLHTQDKRPWEEIMEVLAFSQKNLFWKSNILSPGKFRKQYPKLRMQAFEGSGQSQDAGEETSTRRSLLNELENQINEGGHGVANMWIIGQPVRFRPMLRLRLKNLKEGD